jgi:hypothetical protein
MTIEYALTRIEIVRGFLRSLASSPRYLLTFILYALLMSTVVLATKRSILTFPYSQRCSRCDSCGSRIHDFLATNALHPWEDFKAIAHRVS